MHEEVRLPPIDADGYLVEPGLWTENVARVLAEREGIALSADHWDVLRFMRAYYDEHQVAADARFVIRHLTDRLGPEARNRLFELFP
jgi:tRNA 2-thiouridine synthesizing protein E